jgi:hypothetical protein
MKKFKILIPIAVSIIVVFSLGFKIVNTNETESTLRTTYQVNVTVDEGNCTQSAGCYEYVVIAVNGSYSDSQVFASGTTSYTFYVHDYPVSSICATVTIDNSECPDASATTDCETNVMGPPGIIDLEVVLSCH